MAQKVAYSQGQADKESSPDIEMGFNSETTTVTGVSFPSRLVGRDILSIVMKRHLGGDSVAGETEPVAKKTRLEDPVKLPPEPVFEENTGSGDGLTGSSTEHARPEPLALEAETDEESGVTDTTTGQVNTDQDDGSGLDDSANSFKEINLSLDILNGEGVSADISSFSIEPAKDLDTKESHAQNSNIDVNCGNTVEDQRSDCLKTDIVRDYDIMKKELLSDTKNEKGDVKESQVDSSSKTQDAKSSLAIIASEEDYKVPVVKEERLSLDAESAIPNCAFDSARQLDSKSSGCKAEIKNDKTWPVPKKEINDKTLLVPKKEINNKTLLVPKNEKNAECDIYEKKLATVNDPTDLDVLASAAERRHCADTHNKTEGNAQYKDASKTQEVKDKRKSRKQNAPRRIPCTMTDIKEPEADETEDEINELEEYRSEKSRKQNKPKHISDFSDYDEDSYYVNGRPGFSDTISGASENGIDNGSEDVDSKDSADETYYSEQFNQDHAVRDESDVDTSFNTIPGIPTYMQGQNIREPGFPVSPFHNEMLATLSQSLYQTPDTTEEGKTSIDNLEDNLDVVRRLREIRFYKYRKISVSEKQEIATYAKIHGVSSAAAHFGVSKSAVSMWTRTDFSDMKDDSGKRKRNCMLGNEKFEQLLERVKNEKVNKFKLLSKQDKFEVSRYAKLVGVREMARCLGIALGTVSGWMRQFPYTLKADSMDEEASNMSADVDEDCIANDEASGGKESGNSDTDTTDHTSESQKHIENQVTVKCQVKLDEDERTGQNKAIAFNDDSNSKDSTETVDYDKDYRALQEDEASNASANDSKISKQQEDEVDEMIAESFLAPDIDKCFEDIQDQIRGSPLENDDYFESLFRRVLSCRVAKYKNLKPSEKLEVVRYAKRNGVRRMAKLLGLATGTLSGWTTKYQSLLGLTMDGVPDLSSSQDATMSTDSSFSCQSPSVSQAADSLANIYTQDSQGMSSPVPTSSAVLDNPEKSEVTAIKLLLKEQFPILLKKIEIARQVKFRNISPVEKIEIVKCAKLVGIRPTARVLNMPIGTLSGWITKYTNNLHPVYHVENADSGTSTVDQPQDSDIFRNDIYATSIALMSSPVNNFMGYNIPSNLINPAGIGLMSQMPNSFSQTFISRLGATDLVSGVKTEITEDESESAKSSEDSVRGTDKAFEGARAAGKALGGSRVSTSSINDMGAGLRFNINPGLSTVGSAQFEAETKHMAEQYVRMFNEAQMLKFS